MAKGRSFAKAAIGAVIQGPSGLPGNSYQFSGSQSSADRATKALIAAGRYEQQMQLRKPETGSQSRSSLSAGEQSAIRGNYRSERRFEGENGFFKP